MAESEQGVKIIPLSEQDIIPILPVGLGTASFAELLVKKGVFEKFAVPVVIGEIVDVVAHAMEVFGDRTKALRWFHTPIPSLNDQTPVDMLWRRDGIEQVQEVLGRIEHGVW